MFSLLFRIIQQSFAKVLKSGHRLTFAGRALNKVASESCKVPLISSQPSSRTSLSEQKRFKTKPAAAF